MSITIDRYEIIHIINRIEERFGKDYLQEEIELIWGSVRRFDLEGARRVVSKVLGDCDRFLPPVKLWKAKAQELNVEVFGRSTDAKPREKRRYSGNSEHVRDLLKKFKKKMGWTS